MDNDQLRTAKTITTPDGKTFPINFCSSVKMERGPESAVIIDHVCHVLVATEDFNECENCSLFQVCFKNRRSLCKTLHGEKDGYHYEIREL